MNKLKQIEEEIANASRRTEKLQEQEFNMFNMLRKKTTIITSDQLQETFSNEERDNSVKSVPHHR